MNEVNTTEKQGADLGIIELTPTNCPFTPFFDDHFETVITADLRYRRIARSWENDGSEMDVLIDQEDDSLIINPFARVRVPCHYIEDNAKVSIDQIQAHRFGLAYLDHGNDEEDGFYYVLLTNLSGKPQKITDGTPIASAERWDLATHRFLF